MTVWDGTPPWSNVDDEDGEDSADTSRVLREEDDDSTPSEQEIDT